MVLPRSAVFRAFAPARVLRSAPRTASRALQRRGYASGHGGHKEPSSDIPWAIGAVVATIPTCWYLWPSASHADAHHDQPETKHERAEKLTHEADNHEPAETEEKSTPDSKGSTDDVQFKGKSAAGDEDNKVDDTRKVEDDEKGGKKLRIDSAAAKELGTGEKRREDGSENAASAKPVSTGGEGDISAKQQGISTTATKHSTDIANSPDKSKKGEGMPETAKAQGTVAVDRPSTEQRKKNETEESKSDSSDAEAKADDKTDDKSSEDKPEEKSEDKSDDKPEEKKDE